ncbi:MAG: hypothetical protein QOI78_8157, partial [Actinomycetota bacterium]|nr:hypothetical protein [Actinomycetota bacterium]
GHREPAREPVPGRPRDGGFESDREEQGETDEDQDVLETDDDPHEPVGDGATGSQPATPTAAHDGRAAVRRGFTGYPGIP